MTQFKKENIIYIGLCGAYFFAFLHGLGVSGAEAFLSQILLLTIIFHAVIFTKTIFRTENHKKNSPILYGCNVLICIGIFIAGALITSEGNTWGNFNWALGVLTLPFLLSINSIFMMRGSRNFLFYNGILIFCIGLIYCYQGWIIGFHKGINVGIHADVFFTRKLFLLMSLLFLSIGLTSIFQYLSSKKS